METSWIIKLAIETLEIKVNPFDLETFESDPKAYFARLRNISPEDFNAVVVDRKSLDARKRNIFYNVRLHIYTGSNWPESLVMPHFQEPVNPVHIIGFGPAGIFAALKALEVGLKPIVIERGKAVKERRRDVAKLNRDGIIDQESNYCFGEGGAGTFSDGKLYTRSLKRGKIQEILNYLVLHGANKRILSDAHPHIGTNKLPQIIEAMRQTIIDNGGEVRFNSKFEDLEIESNQVKQIKINDKWELCDNLIIATGHSARDIYYLFDRKKIALEAKPFAMGYRIEHPQELIDNIQYHGSRATKVLEPSSYSVTVQVNGKGVFSFCMCPGGIIAPAATSEGELVSNGWSPSKRNGQFANSGWVTEINEEDWSKFKSHGALAGLKLQESIEQKASVWTGGSLKLPAQNLQDFLAQKKSNQLNDSSYHPGLVSSNLNELYPEAISFRLREGLRLACSKLIGFNHEKAVVVAPESRTSAPIRIPRNRDLAHPDILNLYPCGEGAGFAGGIVSAALDGIRVIKAIKDKQVEASQDKRPS